MQIGSLDITIFVAYFALIVAVGLVTARKKKRSAKDYFMAGDKLPWFLAAASIIAANQSTHNLVGMTGTAYTYGLITANMILLAIPMGQSFLAWVLLPLYLKTGAFTVPQFMERRYDIRSRLAFGSLTVISHVVVEISTVLYLGGLSLTCVFGREYLWWGVGALAFLTGLYTIFGGLLSVVWTEAVQLVILLASGFTLAIVGVAKAGGISHLMATVPEKFVLGMPNVHPEFPFWGVMLGAPIASFFYWGTNQFLVQRPLACKDGWHARMSLIASSYITFLLPIYVIIPGIAASVLLPNLPKGDLAFPTMVETLLPTGLIGLVLAGLIAGMMSHVAGALNSASTILTVDFYQRFFRRDATDMQMVRFGKIAGAIVLFLATLWAPLLGRGARSVFMYIQDAYGFFAPGIVAAFFLGIFWKRGNGNGAFASMCASVPVCYLVQWLLFPVLPAMYRVFWYRTVFGFIICCAIYYLVSIWTAPPAEEKTEGIIWSRALLKEAYPKGIKLRLLSNPFAWWVLANLILASMYVWLR